MYPKDLVQYLHKSLPQELLLAITSEETFALLDELQETHSFTEKQRGILEYELAMRILGLTSKNDLTERVSKNLGVNPEIALQIVSTFDQKVASVLPEKLLQAQEEYGQVKLKEGLIISSSEELLLPEHATPDSPSVEISTPASVLAVEEKVVEPIQTQPEPQPQTTPRYTGGIDPYREPLE
jgi:hypothetical protein